jgi:hypothetical protein
MFTRRVETVRSLLFLAIAAARRSASKTLGVQTIESKGEINAKFVLTPGMNRGTNKVHACRSRHCSAPAEGWRLGSSLVITRLHYRKRQGLSSGSREALE